MNENTNNMENLVPDENVNNEELGNGVVAKRKINWHKVAKVGGIIVGTFIGGVLATMMVVRPDKNEENEEELEIVTDDAPFDTEEK